MKADTEKLMNDTKRKLDTTEVLLCTYTFLFILFRVRRFILSLK